MCPGAHMLRLTVDSLHVNAVRFQGQVILVNTERVATQVTDIKCASVRIIWRDVPVKCLAHVHQSSNILEFGGSICVFYSLPTIFAIYTTCPHLTVVNVTIIY